MPRGFKHVYRVNWGSVDQLLALSGLSSAMIDLEEK